jgi:hypothetical protein
MHDEPDLQQQERGDAAEKGIPQSQRRAFSMTA